MLVGGWWGGGGDSLWGAAKTRDRRYWKGGHRKMHSYFRRNPRDIDGRFMERPEFREEGWSFMYNPEGDDAAGTQHVAKAGDCLLWHGLMPHSGSLNSASDSPRLALIGRWNDPRFGGPPVYFDASGRSDDFTRQLLKVLGHEGGEKVAGWEGVCEGARRHRRYEVPERLFEHWAPEVRDAAPRM